MVEEMEAELRRAESRAEEYARINDGLQVRRC